MEPRIKHHMPEGDGVYMKETFIPKGFRLAMHTHVFSHKSVLVRGRVVFYQDAIAKVYDAPAVIRVKNGVKHSVTALEDTVWFCVHASLEEDTEMVDNAIISRQSEEVVWRG